MTESGFKALGSAVVEQAALDWRYAYRTIKRLANAKSAAQKKRREEAEYLLQDCERFFLSEDFSLFSDLDGKKVLEELKKTPDVLMHRHYHHGDDE